MTSACTRKEMGMRFLSGITGPFLSPAKCFYLGRCYSKLTQIADRSNQSNESTNLRNVRRELRTQIGFAILEIIPVLGSIIRQVDDLSAERREGYKESAFDVFVGYRAKNATRMAKALINQARRIETLTTSRKSELGGNEREPRSPTSPEQRSEENGQAVNQEAGNLRRSPLESFSLESSPDRSASGENALPGGNQEPGNVGEGLQRLFSLASTPDGSASDDEDGDFQPANAFASTAGRLGSHNEGLCFESTDSFYSTPDLLEGPTGGLHHRSFDSLSSGPNRLIHHYYTQSCPHLDSIGKRAQETTV